MTGEYCVVKLLSSGLVVAEHETFGRQIWHTVKTRRDFRCASCRGDIAKGSTCWSPITHDLNRQHRLHWGCLRASEKLPLALSRKSTAVKLLPRKPMRGRPKRLKKR